MVSCMECKHYKYWPATYWDPPESDCTKLESGEIPEEVIDTTYCNGESFRLDEDDPHYCPCFEFAPQPEDY